MNISHDQNQDEPSKVPAGNLPKFHASKATHVPELIIEGKSYLLSADSYQPIATPCDVETSTAVKRAISGLEKFVRSAVASEVPGSQEEYAPALILLAETSTHPESAIQFKECWHTIISDSSPFFRRKKLFQLVDSLLHSGYHEAAEGVVSFIVRSYGFDGNHNFMAKQMLDFAFTSGNNRILLIALHSLRERFLNIKKQIVDEFVSVYETRSSGSFSRLGHEKLRTFFTQVEFNSTLAKDLHSFVMNLTEGGHYTPSQNRPVKEPADWHYHTILKRHQREWEITSYLYEIVNRLKESNHSDESEFHALADAILDFAITTACACATLNLEAWSKEFDGAELNLEGGAENLFMKVDEHPNCNRNFDIRFLRYAELRASLAEGFKHASTVRESVSVLCSIEASKSELSLFKQAAEMLPDNFCIAELYRFEHQWEKAIFRAAKELKIFDFIENGFGGPNSDLALRFKNDFKAWASLQHPNEPNEIHAVCMANLDLAKFLLTQPSSSRRERAIEILESISENSAELFNVYFEENRREDLGLESNGIDIHAILPYFIPLEFKASAFLEASTVSGEHSDFLRSRALELFDQAPIPDMYSQHLSPFHVHLVKRAELVEILCNSLHPRTCEWYSRLGETLNDSVEFLREVRWYDSATKEQRLKQGYSNFGGPERDLNEILRCMNDWAVRLTAKISIHHERIGNGGAAVSYAKSVLQRVEKLSHEEVVCNVSSVLLAAEELLRSTVLREYGKEVYLRIQSALASAIPDTRKSPSRVAQDFIRSVLQSAFTPGEKDELLERLLIDFRNIPRTALENNIEWCSEFVPMLHQIVAIGKHPRTTAESLQLAAFLIETHTFDPEDSFLNHRIAESLAELTKFALRTARFLES